MKHILAFLCLLATATPAWADETYWLTPKSIRPIGNRYYLVRYGDFALEAGETATVWFAAPCPGSVVDKVFWKINALTPGDWDFRESWGFPFDYNTYTQALSIKIRNLSTEDMMFHAKIDVRCDE